MFDKYDVLGHFMGGGVALMVIFVVMAIIGAVTGEDLFEMDPKSKQPEPTEAVSYVSEQVDSNIVPWELVRKMYYAENKYWVDVDGAPVEIRRCEGAEGNGQYYFLPTS